MYVCMHACIYTYVLNNTLRFLDFLGFSISRSSLNHQCAKQTDAGLRTKLRKYFPTKENQL